MSMCGHPAALKSPCQRLVPAWLQETHHSSDLSGIFASLTRVRGGEGGRWTEAVVRPLLSIYLLPSAAGWQLIVPPTDPGMSPRPVHIYVRLPPRLVKLLLKGRARRDTDRSKCLCRQGLLEACTKEPPLKASTSLRARSTCPVSSPGTICV